MLDYRWALGPGFGDLVVSGGVGSGFGQSRASLATPGPCSCHFPEPLQGPHIQGISFQTIPGLYFSPETCSCALKTLRGTQLGVKSKRGTHVLATRAVVF